MKVLLMTNFIPSRGGGGIERHVYDLALGLINRGVDVSIACDNQQHFPGNYDLLKDKIMLSDVKHWRAPKLLKTSRRLANLTNACEYSARLIQRSTVLSNSYDASEFDIIHAHAQIGCFSMIKNKLLGGKKPRTVTTLHGTAAGFYKSMRMHHIGPPVPTPEIATSMFMEFASAKLSDACIAVSKDVGTVAERSYKVPKDRVHVIYNWADRQIFNPVDKIVSRKTLGLKPDGRYLLFVGRADKMKGFNMLLDSMKYIGKNATLLIVSNDIGARKSGVPDNVKYLGYIDEQLPLYYSACDLFAFPSLSEGLPLTLIEAMSCGAVPVYMNVPPMGEVVDGSMGYPCEHFDPKEYASLVLNALHDSDLPNRSHKCIEGSYKFDMDKSVDSTKAIYELLLRN